jgi:hypothetical protein
MATARTPINIWSTTFEKLKELSDTTKKPMTQLIDEAIDLLSEQYAQAATRATRQEGL